MLSTTIPYSKGWKINKSKKDLPRINTAFIGIPVKKGFNFFNRYSYKSRINSWQIFFALVYFPALRIGNCRA
ncbi:hypothetical protein [Oenococcus oeni]|uniref:hypothetical protein n=1 Tax=Oenococcus oeni TaxID=1247 RepID=UPI0039C9EEB9